MSDKNEESLTKLQAAFKSKQDEYHAIESEANGQPMTKEQLSKYQAAVSAAEELAQQVDLAVKARNFDRLMEEPDGNAYIPATFDREVTPEDGEIPGVTVDGKTGEMYSIDGALKKIGDEKLKALKSGAYKDAFAEWIRAKGLNRLSSMKGNAMKILNEGSDPAGGAWLPPDFRPELQKRMAAMATVRPDASVYVTGSDHITFPTVNYNGSTTDDTYARLFTSGVRFAFRGSVGSTTDFTEATNPIAGQVAIPVQLATASIVVMREQMEDNSFDLLGYINELGAESFALGEEYYYTLGSGAGQPRGFTKHPANQTSTGAVTSYSTYSTVAGTTYWGNVVLSGTTAVAWGAFTSYTSTANTGILSVEALLDPQYESDAKWYGNKGTYAAIRTINAGTATLPQWSLGDSWPNYANGYNASLLGYSVRKNQMMSAVGTGLFGMCLANMKGYFIVDRVGLSVDVNPYIYQNRDQVLIYMRKRTGGDLVQYWKMKVLTTT